MYLKNAAIIEKMSKIDTIIFDKTGTLTSTKKNEIQYQGKSFSGIEKEILQNAVRISNHPLSRMLYDTFGSIHHVELDAFKEIVGKGIEAKANGVSIKIGSQSFVENSPKDIQFETTIHISINGEYFGKYVFKNAYRKYMKRLFQKLKNNYNLSILSGDNEGEKKYLEKIEDVSSYFTYILGTVNIDNQC